MTISGNQIMTFRKVEINVIMERLTGILTLTTEQLAIFESDGFDTIASDYMSKLLEIFDQISTSQFNHFDTEISIDSVIGTYLNKYETASTTTNTFTPNAAFTYDTSTQVKTANIEAINKVKNTVEHPIILVPFKFVLQDGTTSEIVTQKIKSLRVSLQYVRTTTTLQQQKITTERF